MTNADDCDDSNALIHPEAAEVVDGVDNDCDGLVDEYAHAIAIDGINDFTAADEQFSTSSTSYNAYVAWDDVYLYVGYDGADVAASSATKWLLIYVDGVAANTMTTGAIYNTQQPNLPFAAGYHIAWRTDGFTMALVNDGTAWGDGLWVSRRCGSVGYLRGTEAAAGRLGHHHLPVCAEGSRLHDLGGNGGERSYAAMPASSFADGYGPDYTKVLRIHPWGHHGAQRSRHFALTPGII